MMMMTLTKEIPERDVMGANGREKLRKMNKEVVISMK